MNKELEEAIRYFRKRMDICLENAKICDENDFDEEATCLRKEQILIEIVLKYIENSIPKQILIEKIRERQFELQQEYIDFKDDIKLNTLQDLLEGK